MPRSIRESLESQPLRGLVLNPTITNWVGIADKVELANWPEYGHATFSVHITSNVRFTTVSDSLSDAVSTTKTLIPKASPVFSEVS
jgi:hypothetical protein